MSHEKTIKLIITGFMFLFPLHVDNLSFLLKSFDNKVTRNKEIQMSSTIKWGRKNGNMEGGLKEEADTNKQPPKKCIYNTELKLSHSSYIYNNISSYNPNH